jgi:membrane associated rhomboid family serine protease
MWQSGPVRKSDALLRGGLTEADAMRLVVLLAASGIEPGVEYDGRGRLDLYVTPDDLEAALRLLAEEDVPAAAEHAASDTAHVEGRLSAPEAEIDAPEHWFGRGTAAVIALMAICVAVFVDSQLGPDAGSRTRLLALGAIDYAHIEAGEHWRFLSAIFVHFDVVHLVSNMAVMLIVAPPLAHQLGPLRFVLVFLATGFAGNVASHVISPAVGLKAGASGAIAGVLGALGGHALQAQHRSRKAWQVFGALAAFYGLLIGFGPGRDNVAHAAGLIAGIALGRWLEPEPPAHALRRASSISTSDSLRLK